LVEVDDLVLAVVPNEDHQRPLLQLHALLDELAHALVDALADHGADRTRRACARTLTYRSLREEGN
jgi:hypothetical protein